MNTTQILNTVMEYLGDITRQYATGIMLASLVFALLNCFMGYRLRKVWGSLLGLFAGAATGAGATYYFFGTEYMLAAALAGAVVVSIIAWIFYKLGIFLLCAGLVYLLTESFFTDLDGTSRLVCLIVALFAATMAIGYERIMIIGITGICGGIGAVTALFSLTGMEKSLGIWILGLILAGLGIAFQAGPYLRHRRSTYRDGSDRGGRSGRRKRRSMPSLPSLPSLPARRKKRTKTVYRTETVKNRNTERRSTTSAPEQRKRSTQQQEPVRTETMQKQNGGVVDLDDLNRELSREIKKIYKDEREHLG
ncbi:MAG: hypothetical protein ACI4E0_02675 [Blautia sp.]|nr:hypothetical protein [Blautia sp.]